MASFNFDPRLGRVPPGALTDYLAQLRTFPYALSPNVQPQTGGGVLNIHLPAPTSPLLPSVAPTPPNPGVRQPPWEIGPKPGTPLDPLPPIPRLWERDWVQLQRPEEMERGEGGSGYYVYGTDRSKLPGTAANAQWGRSRTMLTIHAVADILSQGRAPTPLGIGNLSMEDGGPFKPHGPNHQTGLGVDVRPARKDGAGLPVTYQSPQYDREATQRIVDAFLATGQVKTILFNDTKIRGVKPYSGHDNHMHVQLKD